MEKSEQLAQAIASGAILHDLPWIILWLALLMLATLAAGYFTAWAQKRGEVNAARSDRMELMKQFADKAGVEEGAKSVIQRAEWKAKELATVRRIKLEELMIAFIECNEYLVREMLWWYQNRPCSSPRQPGL